MYVSTGSHICSGAHGSNVRCMYTAASYDIGNSSVFICVLYIDICVSYLHMS